MKKLKMQGDQFKNLKLSVSLNLKIKELIMATFIEDA